MRVLLVGCGALGRAIARGVSGWPGVALQVHDVDAPRASALAAEVGGRHAHDVDAALREVDVVVEAAAQGALRDLAPRVLRRGLPLVALSVGALGDADFLDEIDRLARAHGGGVLVPSGALAGLDAVRAGMQGGLDEVLLVTAKPPAGFGLTGLTAPKVLFEGPAREAVLKYPKNVNVAASLSLAGIGFDRTRVRIVADPALTRNTHTIEARGAFGRLSCRVENEPSPENPASSHLASLAALAVLRRFVDPLHVGT